MGKFQITKNLSIKISIHLFCLKFRRNDVTVKVKKKSRLRFNIDFLMLFYTFNLAI